MKLAVIIPDRNDRPLFLANCLRMLKAQTLQPDHIEIVNDEPISKDVDITWRYKTGYDRLRNKGFELIAFIENDDWYSPDYLQTMVNKWEEEQRPDMIGTNYTIYYNIRVWGYFTMYHMERSSAMSTLIKPDIQFSWCNDNEPFTDMYLWNLTQHGTGIFNHNERLRGAIFKPEKHICLGIKHGIGMCGGRSHTDKLDRYTSTKQGTEDHNKEFLKSVMDNESFEFYSNYLIQ